MIILEKIHTFIFGVPTKNGEPWNGCCAYGEHVCTYCGNQPNEQGHKKDCKYRKVVKKQNET